MLIKKASIVETDDNSVKKDASLRMQHKSLNYGINQFCIAVTKLCVTAMEKLVYAVMKLYVQVK